MRKGPRKPQRMKWDRRTEKYCYVWMPRAEALANWGRPCIRPPLSPTHAAFGKEVKRTRIRFLMTQEKLAEMFGVGRHQIKDIEIGMITRSSKYPMLVEKLRIWVESVKPLSQRRRENVEFDPFADLEKLVKEKEQDNGRTHTQ